MQDEERWLRSLGLVPGATRLQVDNAYRDLVKVWHPDRFQTDPALRPKAEAKLREINEAYENLRRLPTPGTELSVVVKPPRPSAPADKPADTTADTTKDSAARGRGRLQLLTAALLAAAVIGGGLLFFGQQRDSAPAADVALEAGRDNGAATGAGEPATTGSAPRRAQPQPAGPGGTEAPIQPDRAAPMPSTSATLAVVSQPTAATVYVDDRLLGQTPLTLSAVEPGLRRIRLELDGHPVWSSSVRVEAGSREKLLAVFEPPARR